MNILVTSTWPINATWNCIKWKWDMLVEQDSSASQSDVNSCNLNLLHSDADSWVSWHAYTCATINDSCVWLILRLCSTMRQTCRETTDTRTITLMTVFCVKTLAFFIVNSAFTVHQSADKQMSRWFKTQCIYKSYQWNIKAKYSMLMHLAVQKLKWCVLILVVISKDSFEERDNSEKINMEISGGVIWLDETWTWFAQILVSPADQCDLQKEDFSNSHRRQEFQNYLICFKNVLFSC